MHCLGGTGADQDSQDFHMGCPLRHSGVKAGATLFDGRKVKSRRVGDRLNVERRSEVGVASGDCRKASRAKQIGNSLRKSKRWIEVGVVGVTAIPSPPTGVHGELHEVSKPGLSAGPSGRTARQGAELVEING